LDLEVQFRRLSPTQKCLKRIAARGDSVSAVKKARTYIPTTLEFAVDEVTHGA
jgi:hypothetical protein